MSPSSAAAPARTPRLVATDLDGTLIRTDGSVSAYTASVLAELDRRDVPVVFVTGRPLRWAREVFEYVGSHGLAIVTNGAMVWDVATDGPRLERAIQPDVALSVASTLRESMPDVLFSVETVEGWSVEEGLVHGRRIAPVRVGSLEEILAGPVLKLMARRDGANPDEFVASAVELVGEVVEVTHSSFPLLEISARGVTKASTLAMLCEDLGIAATDVVAFGDMPNDLPMLTWAGLSYAMADAHPDVVSCASRLAPGHDDDGVATVLAELLGL
ncbi:HAD family hydrolase [Nocardioides sp. Kera G14]|uniref:HAD family hydrolase n=1 Tax=Nocardioides sp. Kera G14 TaxID=2884264 RepID=UPI001D11FD67|nr:HAD family hydrolase [Nocardioides sp. Kera G14]UDY23345.1 Cof-type HAD-IIB family hydrolase [Nocardioides sp. Kera G14]